MQGRSDPNRELLDAASLCGQLVSSGSVEGFLADHRLELFPDQLFADLFPSQRGRPSVPADVIASAMVLQSLEGLSDRDTARALRDRISWKVACGLALDDEGFDYSVLTYWRARLRNSQRPERIFDAVREVVKETGVLKGKTRRALDSTLLDDAVATQDTVTQLISAIRRVRRQVPGASEVEVSAHDYDRAGKPAIAWDDEVAKAALIDGLVRDALSLLEALKPTEETNETLGLLALVAGQDVEQAEDGTWRIVEGTAPERIVSTVDTESRHMHKSPSQHRDGYKAHVCVEPETGLITECTLTPANASDATTGVALLSGEEPGLEVLGDGAYGTGEALAALEEAGHVSALKPYPSSAKPGYFHRDEFEVDEEAGTVICPAGQVAKINRARRVVFGIRCATCPLRGQCTSGKRGRTLTLHPHDALLAGSRRAWRQGDFAAAYRRWRPMVERSIAWLTARGNRRVRFRGVERNRFGLSMRVAAINLRRLLALGLHRVDGWALGNA